MGCNRSNVSHSHSFVTETGISELFFMFSYFVCFVYFVHSNQSTTIGKCLLLYVFRHIRFVPYFFFFYFHLFLLIVRVEFKLLQSDSLHLVTVCIPTTYNKMYTNLFYFTKISIVFQPNEEEHISRISKWNKRPEKEKN